MTHTAENDAPDDDDTTPHWQRADGSSRYDAIVAADRQRRVIPPVVGQEKQP
jgi:hypothetical protein